MKSFISVFSRGIITISLVLICSLLSFANPDPEDSANIEMVGYTLDDNKKLGNATVVVYKKNEKVSTLTADKKGRFYIYLEKNEKYTIEVIYDGYFTKRLAIETKIPSSVSPEEGDIPSFEFDVSLINKASIKDDQDTFVLDFPSTRIEYSKGRKQFHYNMEYTRNIQREIKEVLSISEDDD